MRNEVVTRSKKRRRDTEQSALDQDENEADRVRRPGSKKRPPNRDSTEQAASVNAEGGQSRQNSENSQNPSTSRQETPSSEDATSKSRW